MTLRTAVPVPPPLPLLLHAVTPRHANCTREAVRCIPASCQLQFSLSHLIHSTHSLKSRGIKLKRHLETIFFPELLDWKTFIVLWMLWGECWCFSTSLCDFLDIAALEARTLYLDFICQVTLDQKALHLQVTCEAAGSSGASVLQQLRN